MMRRKRNNLLIALLFVSWFANAQQFRHTAVLGGVKKDGFYSIPVSAELSSYLKTDLSDIRIADEKGQWVPHITRWPRKNVVIESILRDLTIIKKERIVAATILIVSNKNKQNITNLIISIKNTSANRKAILSGGDDQNNWFTITDSIRLQPEASEDKLILKIPFPSVNYSYFKVAIFNGKNDPYNIIGVATEGHPIQENTFEQRKFITNPGLHFSQKDTGGFSLITIKNQDNFHFNKLKLSISSPHFYNRRARLYSKFNGLPLNTLFYNSPVEEYIISSGNTGEFDTPWMKDSVLYFLIENKDNPPLNVDNIITQQISKELIAYLEKGKQYKLLFDDPFASAPDYDLQKFRDRIPDTIDNLKTGPISPFTKGSINDKSAQKNFWHSWMWPVIIFVLLLLGYFTFSLTKDIKKKNNSG
jgi:hypothetical protein